MNLIDLIERESVKLGYRGETLRRDYEFSNVWGKGDTTARCLSPRLRRPRHPTAPQLLL